MLVIDRDEDADGDERDEIDGGQNELEDDDGL